MFPFDLFSLFVFLFCCFFPLSSSGCCCVPQGVSKKRRDRQTKILILICSLALPDYLSFRHFFFSSFFFPSSSLTCFLSLCAEIDQVVNVHLLLFPASCYCFFRVRLSPPPPLNLMGTFAVEKKTTPSTPHLTELWKRRKWAGEKRRRLKEPPQKVEGKTGRIRKDVQKLGAFEREELVATSISQSVSGWRKEKSQKRQSKTSLQKKLAGFLLLCFCGWFSTTNWHLFHSSF